MRFQSGNLWVAGACDDHRADDGEGDHERVDDSESGDGVHAEELADHDAVDHGAHGRREQEQDESGQLYVKGVSDDASVGADCVSGGHLCSLVRRSGSCGEPYRSIITQSIRSQL